MNWLSENSQTVSALVSTGTLAVWMIYLHVFLRSFRQQNRANILINLGGGHGLDARCLVTNMSANPIYIYAMKATLYRPDGPIRSAVTELDAVEEWQNPSDLQLWTRQGPLQPGGVRDMGAMRAIIDHVLRKRSEQATPPEQAGIESIEIQVAAVFAPEELLAAAARHFTVIAGSETLAIRANTLGTKQIRSHRERREMEREIAQDLT